ncbi:MAG: hypothetical protein IKY83_14475 [Proteobacteria bacterium]|nr:hypothetical protein [Pseudomonadota bacterium]
MRSDKFSELLKFSRHLYDQGFSFLAFVLFALLFAVSGGDPQIRPVGSRMLPSAAVRTASQGTWREVESAWLSGRATQVAQDLRSRGVRNVTVYSRVKAEDSAREKAERKGIDMMALNDLYGMRVVVSNELDAYQCLNMICDTYTVVPGTMKDYIVAPKASGYQSLHVVAEMDAKRVEFQIRTTQMHLNAEAEHEAYKARMRAVA